MASGQPVISPQPVEEILRRLSQSNSAVVALSGGVDSSLVASLARSALAETARAITIAGPAVARSEVGRAREVARLIGIEHVVLWADPLSRPEYVQNPVNRCYFCRSFETERMIDWGRARGVALYLDGIHRDDLDDDRPGIRAMDEAGFHHPLLEAGWGKEEIRHEARQRGLPNWDQPSEACLSSRVEHGEAIEAATLQRIEEAEEFVRALGFRRVRVRVSRSRARVVVDPEEVGRLRAETTASQVRQALLGFGFLSVELDPRGYRRRTRDIAPIPASELW